MKLGSPQRFKIYLVLKYSPLCLKKKKKKKKQSLYFLV